MSVAGRFGLYMGGFCLRKSLSGGLCPGSLCPVNKMTDGSKNITLPQTSLAGCDLSERYY